MEDDQKEFTGRSHQLSNCFTSQSQDGTEYGEFYARLVILSFTQFTFSQRQKMSLNHRII